MELVKPEQIQRPEHATPKQVMYVERLAKHFGFFVNTKNMTKNEASEQIEQFKKLLDGEKNRKIKENEVKVAMVKKLIYKRWVAKDKEINRQTEKAFMKEVYYVHRVFIRIDELIASGEAALKRSLQ
jgi:hypothetical protein